MVQGVKGVVGTPVTPFTADGAVDDSALEKTVGFLVESGVAAIALPMHIGESLNLSDAERRRVAEIAISTAARQVPVLVNVSLPGTDNVIALARHAQGAGAAGIVVITPYHWRPPDEALLKHFAAVAGAVEIGMVAYNFPAKLGVGVSPSLVMRMLDLLPNFAGLKDAGLDMEYFTEICRITSKRDFGVYAGVEYMLPSMVVGGSGSFSALGAVAPRLVSDLYLACSAGDLSRALALQRQFSELWQLLQIGYPATIKVAMTLLGRPVGGPRLPILPLTDAEIATLKTKLDGLEFLEREPRGWEGRART
ncbi:MAG TPA: dihydrodipicolinate synthase family protein [Candidatus Nitrosotalea sp.]|nr:dihydrodipicolinate synthase family protein [Candidatus Nitrosotalea sp.]